MNCSVFLIYLLSAGVLFKLDCCLLLKQVENKRTYKQVLLLAYQSFGIVFGDLSISPLYVYRSTFSGRLDRDQSEDVIFGAFSLIFWTLTLHSLFKYVIIMLNADDNGEGKSSYVFQR